ncbi:MAG: SDR family oxidoreductase [Alphaproteobacteria bacterium]|nr:SDR family oxidoreductase [Alphaproteobacteria bacterium]
MGSDMGEFAGKNALITGTSGPLGAAIARGLAAAGARVALHYRGSEPRALAQEIRTAGGICAPVQADISREGFAPGLMTEVIDLIGPVDILVNCAADQALKGDTTPFASLLATNTIAAEALMRQVAEVVPRAGIAIVNISSLEASRAAPGHARYAASKAALESLTRSMAAELGPKGIRVNAVAPGLIARPGLENDWPEGVARWRTACPLGRLGTPKDVAAAVMFLASPKAAWITGTVLMVDGGTHSGPGW